jgi:hypothetical protein
MVVFEGVLIADTLSISLGAEGGEAVAFWGSLIAPS